MVAPDLTQAQGRQSQTGVQTPTRFGRLLRRLDFAVVGYLRRRGLICRPMPWRRRREEAASRALCELPGLASLREYEQLAAPVRQELLPSYERYTAEVSPDWMAVSFELAVFLAVLCRCLRPGRIIDLGTGYSSCVLRRYQQESAPAPEVWSVDDAPAWLARTRQFLEGQELSTANLTTWEEFAAQPPGRFDRVLHDRGSRRVRRATREQAHDHAVPGRIVVLDDANSATCRRQARRLARARGLEPHGLEHPTRDRYGRYAMLIPTGPAPPEA